MTSKPKNSARNFTPRSKQPTHTLILMETIALALASLFALVIAILLLIQEH